MRILEITPYAPVPPTWGGALRIFHLLKQMVKRHTVTLLTYGGAEEYRLLREYFGDELERIYLMESPWTNHWRRLGQLYALGTNHSYFHLQVYTRRMQRFLDRLMERHDIDLIQSEFAVLGAFDLKTGAPRILDAHNVEYDNFRRMCENAPTLLRRFHYRREYRKFFAEEIAACRKHDAIFVTSPRDKAILDGDVPEIPKFILPNGVDTAYFTPTAEPPDPFALVFTGMMAYVPNYDGMQYFLDAIFPRILRSVPQAKIYIVGSRPPRRLLRRAADNVIVTGYVDDVRPYIQRASVYVVPLRMGGGTRLKVVEAMSMRRPIVSTSIGCEGIGVQDGESLLVRDDPSAFADAVVELLGNRRKASMIGERGYEEARMRFDWSTIGMRMEEVWEHLRSPHRGQTTETRGTIIHQQAVRE